MASINQFDPTGLERGAKALREINQSPHAGAALALQVEQEKTKQLASEKQKSESDAKTWEKRKEYLEAETEEHKKRADYEDQLARKRADEQRQQRLKDARKEDEQREAAMKRIEGMKRATEARIQEEKRATIAAEHEMHVQSIRATELARAEGAMRIERHNKDLHLARLELEKSQERQTFIAVAQTAVSAIATRMGNFLRDPEAVAKTVAVASSLFIAYHGAKKGTSVVGNYVASNLGRPALVRETSRRSYLSARELWRRASGSYRVHGSRGLGEIVLASQEAERIKTLAASVKCAKEHNLPHRHILLHGPPGTGKTMFGRVLAFESGMDYAVMTGGDVGPLGKDAVTELHRLFDWALRSRNGLVVFMDEADAFLRAWPPAALSAGSACRSQGALTGVLRCGVAGRRDRDGMSEEMRAALNAFLYNTGTESSKFMLVLATNQPQLLDTAVIDRVDSSVLFKLPVRAYKYCAGVARCGRHLSSPCLFSPAGAAQGEEQRLQMLQRFWTERVDDFDLRQKIGVDDSLGTEHVHGVLERVAAETEGLSGRSLAQLMNSAAPAPLPPAAVLASGHSPVAQRALRAFCFRSGPERDAGEGRAGRPADAGGRAGAGPPAGARGRRVLRGRIDPVLHHRAGAPSFPPAPTLSPPLPPWAQCREGWAHHVLTFRRYRKPARYA